MALANNILQLLPEAGREMPGSPYNSHRLLGMLRRVPASLTLTEYHSLKLVGFLEWKCWTEGQFNQRGEKFHVPEQSGDQVMDRAQPRCSMSGGRRAFDATFAWCSYVQCARVNTRLLCMKTMS